jgi:hypothetical protein
MPPIPDRLARLLTYHENAAAAIRATIALLQQQPDGRASNGHSPTMHAALSLDEERRAKKNAIQREWRKTHPKKPQTGTTARGKGTVAQRQRTADTLAHFDLKTPKLPGELPFKPTIGILVTTGYLKKDPKGGGYLRTAKPYQVHPKKVATT